MALTSARQRGPSLWSSSSSSTTSVPTSTTVSTTSSSSWRKTTERSHSGVFRLQSGRLETRRRWKWAMRACWAVLLLLGTAGMLSSMVIPNFLWYRPQNSSTQQQSLSAPLPPKQAAVAAPFDTLKGDGQVDLQAESSAEEGPSSVSVPSSRLIYYLEPTTTLSLATRPLPRRNTAAHKLIQQDFPPISDCQRPYLDLPIDNFPEQDPFLPWIHDYFLSSEGDMVRFVAQNKRRCETGTGKESLMRYWEPQMALFQPLSIRQDEDVPPTEAKDGDPHRHVTYRLSSPEQATAPETRFLCHFHNENRTWTATTLSVYPFNYEFVNWRKRQSPMFSRDGSDVERFEFSQLMFSCPIPEQLRPTLKPSSSTSSANKVAASLWLDLVPIRTPARYDEGYLFTQDHVGPSHWRTLKKFDTQEHYGSDHVLPPIEDSGRIANLPLCLPPTPTTSRSEPGRLNLSANSDRRKPFRLAICTWTSASYQRRGDRTTIADSTLRLKEWIAFHRLVGADRIYIYDNTILADMNWTESPLQAVAEAFPEDVVVYHRWPARVCNNNRPNHRVPGERSSQYAAEASCRERYGPLTDWMAFIDTDEYLVPMRNETWDGLLKEMEQRSNNNKHVLKMRSSRGRPRLDLMEPDPDTASCVDPLAHHRRKQTLPQDPCVIPRRNETFLRVYNCDYIKPPRPDRFSRAMKQIYRPSFVYSHFVHYSTITADIARIYADRPSNATLSRLVRNHEWGDVFLDELKEGVLVHTKSVLPFETMRRTAFCYPNSTVSCSVGVVCPDSTPFVDEDHQSNPFVDEQGHYCNCWLNQHVEHYWLPQLEASLQSIK